MQYKQAHLYRSASAPGWLTTPTPTTPTVIGQPASRSISSASRPARHRHCLCHRQPCGFNNSIERKDETVCGCDTYFRPRTGAPLAAFWPTRLLARTSAHSCRSIEVLTLPVLERDLLVWTELTDTQYSALACALVSAGHRAVLPRSRPPPSNSVAMILW